VKQNKLEVLTGRLDYPFQDIHLLECALSHRSYGKTNNERLEFLGDSIVNFIIAGELYRRFPKATEGELSRLRAHLVKEDALANLAKDFNLSDFLRLGRGEKMSGGHERVSILADALEAIIAAIYLDGGLMVCYQKVTAWYEPYFKELSLDNLYKDSKSLLQELLQGKQLPLPEYRLIKTEGSGHKQQFTVECKTALFDSAIQGVGHSRRKAEQQAAEQVLRAFDHES